MKVLALSSSRVGNGSFLEAAVPVIQQFAGDRIQNIAFIPFASVQKDYDEYGDMVKNVFKDTHYSIHNVIPQKAASILDKADLIMVGGGNTFKLLHDIYELDLFELIKDKVKSGSPYIGWSAGANISGKTISTTNDMPIIEPKTFSAFGFFPFQINPHYINLNIEGHNGETRDQRLEEFILLNPGIPVVGLPEGTALRLENKVLHFIGEKNGILFENSMNNLPGKRIITGAEDISFLLES